MRSRGSMARRLSGIGRGIRTRRRRRSRTCWRRADYSYGKHGLRSRVLREQMGKKNWDGCWSTWRPATEQEALEPEKGKKTDVWWRPNLGSVAIGRGVYGSS